MSACNGSCKGSCYWLFSLCNLLIPNNLTGKRVLHIRVNIYRSKNILFYSAERYRVVIRGVVRSGWFYA